MAATVERNLSLCMRRCGKALIRADSMCILISVDEAIRYQVQVHGYHTPAVPKRVTVEDPDESYVRGKAKVFGKPSILATGVCPFC